MEKDLSFQEQAFVNLYLKYFDAKKAALDSGYSENIAKKAKTWVSVTGCPENKRHVRDAIAEGLEKLYGLENINKDWVIRRARLLADFTISKFIETSEKGEAVFNFSDATPDDWYCIEEYTTQTSFMKIQEDGKEELIPVRKIKLKSTPKIAALRLIGDHVDVAAFKVDEDKEPVIVNVNIDGKEYDKVRKKVLDDDSC